MQYHLSTEKLSRAIDPLNAANPAVYEDISPRCIGIMDCCLKPIRRAVNAATAPIQKVRVDHRCAYILVTQKLLNGANIVSILK